jgi:hypothetical protein
MGLVSNTKRHRWRERSVRAGRSAAAERHAAPFLTADSTAAAGRFLLDVQFPARSSKTRRSRQIESAVANARRRNLLLGSGR